MTSCRHDRVFGALFVALFVHALVLPAQAQDQLCDLSATATRTDIPVGHWPPPLDRSISLVLLGTTLRDALSRVARAADLRLSYSSDLVPLDRIVCNGTGKAAAGDILTTLLIGTGLEPTVVGHDHVVVSPVRKPSAPLPTVAPSAVASSLEAVTVTARGSGIPSLGGVVAGDVLDGRRLAEHDTRTLAQALDAMVPGIWMWEQSPSSLMARYGSIRGASSFGVTAPKVYIDGVEVANSLLLTRLDPQSIARVEVIRGPQGAALFGADAINGVINVVSRGGADSLTRGLQLRNETGLSSSTFASAPVLSQRTELSARTGSNLRSSGFGLTFNAFGDYVPGAGSREFTASGDTRIVGAHGAVTGAARLLDAEAGWGPNPMLAVFGSQRDRLVGRFANSLGILKPGSLAPSLAEGLTLPQKLRQYSANMTAVDGGQHRWTPSVTVGIDGYRLSNVAFARLPTPNASDSALRDARGGADRLTIRLNTAGQFGSTENAVTEVTLSAEHSVLRDATWPLSGTLLEADSIRGTPSSDAAWYRNTGLVLQTNVAVRNSFFVSSGIRLERLSGLEASAMYALLPMLGAAYQTRISSATVKLRSAYGEAIRPARVALDDGSLVGATQTVARAGLPPERQSGVELGADIDIGDFLSLRITRFDQKADGLIQSVPIFGTGTTDGPRLGTRISYDLQNVGEISNRGLEAQLSLGLGVMTITGSYSTVDSRVTRLADGYLGDLQPGDRMLEVPARTLGLTATGTFGRFASSLSVARASNWISYDGVALAQALASGNESLRSVNAQPLRAFWREYPGVTRLRASFSYQLLQQLGLTLSGENLLGQQHGEPDNLTIVPGRTISVGFRAKR